FERDACLFEEFAPRGGQRIFVLLEETLRNGPDAVVLLRKERSAWMDEEELERALTPPKDQDPGAGLQATRTVISLPFRGNQSIWRLRNVGMSKMSSRGSRAFRRFTP